MRNMFTRMWYWVTTLMIFQECYVVIEKSRLGENRVAVVRFVVLIADRITSAFFRAGRDNPRLSVRRGTKS